MAGKRKRTRHSASDHDQKRQKISKPSPGTGNSKDPIIKQTLLSRYYPQVLTLREYLFQRLPNTSKIRRKKILSVGRDPSEEGLSAFIDSTLVGVSVCTQASQKERWQQWTTFSQRADESASTFINLSSPGVFSQSEVRVNLSRSSHVLTVSRLLTLPSGYSSLKNMQQMDVFNICCVKDFRKISIPVP